ncbi:DUF1385 domain-containing protein [Shimazuella sp. AN120528]|uniref:DUF1385 domain-containing protein n=1 Tax=Shimazuella soli TaxID=1892854 RepID=UPI001F0D9830|nr:DUF1385 domain-containing protein [Shimazuella soli]MCH5584157.1 DUF1385 domain-containing protein [Shimazuella soli]
MPDKIVPYGGQAVIEGVMFGGRNTQVTAVRRKNGEIETLELEKKHIPWVNMLKRIPLIRGIVSLIEASASGAKHLQYATEMYEQDEEGTTIEKAETKKTGKMEMMIGVAIIGVLSLIAGKVIFTLLPAALASWIFDPYVKSMILQNLIEGGIKTILLLSYLWAISRTPIMKRVFQYHGAEHKVISAYENSEELTVRNVQKYSTLHYRCGSSFMIFTVIVGVIVYSFFTYDSVWDRVLTRLLLLPLVIGLSFEVLKLTNSARNIPVLQYLGYPGLWLQKLTTREPDDDQVEVAIAAFKRMRELDEAYVEKKQLSSTVTESVQT